MFDSKVSHLTPFVDRLISEDKNAFGLAMKRDLHQRFRQFAKRILRLAAALRRIPSARRLADQIARCGPSIGLNYAESQAASSRAHFITIIETAEREARETQVRFSDSRNGAALEMISDPEDLKPALLVDLYQESCEIVAILTTIAKNAKANPGKGKHRKGKRFSSEAKAES